LSNSTNAMPFCGCSGAWYDVSQCHLVGVSWVRYDVLQYQRWEYAMPFCGISWVRYGVLQNKKHSLKKQKPYFCNAKTYFLHAKNHTFATQKGGFWKPLSIVLCFSMIDCVRLKGGEHTPKAIFGMCKTSGKLLF